MYIDHNRQTRNHSFIHPMITPLFQSPHPPFNDEEEADSGDSPSFSSSSSSSSSLIETFTSGWWVFLMVNVSSKANRSTQICLSQKPDLTMLKYNVVKKKVQNMWVIVARVGKFDTYHEAVLFYTAWDKKSRGLTNRVAKGINLVKRFPPESNVRLWLTTKSKSKATSFFYKERVWLESYSLAATTTTTTAIVSQKDKKSNTPLLTNTIASTQKCSCQLLTQPHST